ncbi:MAG: succinate dehydrogenase assembly factor 2 [Pseudomonadota bacterium]|nr:succinate dehydrogenase assembly factor 2 [Pseudomonadota bacterium]
MSVSSFIRRKRLLYQAQYRGFKEADLLIGGFAAAHLAGMGETDLDEFERLLGFPDHDLFAWATGAAEPPDGVAGPVFELLRAFDISAITAP